MSARLRNGRYSPTRTHSVESDAEVELRVQPAEDSDLLRDGWKTRSACAQLEEGTATVQEFAQSCHGHSAQAPSEARGEGAVAALWENIRQ
jgi:hypothetical protein